MTTTSANAEPVTLTCSGCGTERTLTPGLVQGLPLEDWWETVAEHHCADCRLVISEAPFPPTDEQLRVVALFATGDDVVVQAGAGAGKTATLQLVANHALRNGRRGWYGAFNKAIVVDTARKMAKSVECSTMHSLAMRAVGFRFRHRLDSSRQRNDEIARILGIDPIVVPYGNRTKRLAAGWLAGKAMAAVRQFCRSEDPEVARGHFAYIAAIDPPDERGNRTYENNDYVAAYLLPFARKAWEDLCDPDGRLRYNHDCYLKLWSLNDPVIDKDFVLFDEAQDADPVQVSIIESFKRHGTQVVVVGDEQQVIYCQPEGTSIRLAQALDGRTWGSREVPIESVRSGDRVVSWGGTWRLGAIHQRGSVVTDVWSESFDGELVTVETASGLRSRYTPDHHCVVLLGEPIHGGAWTVYMARRGEHYRVGACQTVYSSQGGTFGPMVRAKQENADAVWVLSQHASKRSALDAETACHRWVPSRCFVSSDGSEWWSGRGPGTEAARRLLAAFGRSIEAPLLDRGDGEWFDRNRTPFVTQARNLLSGMMVLPADNTVRKNRAATVRKQSWEPVTVGREPYRGTVISLTVDADHTYVADGIVTHNSWRGAVDALARFEESGASVAFLSQSFRFGPAVADEANGLLERLDARLRIRGHDPVDSKVGPHALPDAILCRSNAAAVRVFRSELADGRRAFLVGGTADIISFCEAALLLQTGQHCSHPELACFDDWAAVEEYVKNDEQGDDLKLLVDLVNENGAQAIVDLLRQQPAHERDADVVVSTAHKSKGREWDVVRINDDFHPPRDGGDLPDSELRLAYVAVTRAKRHLDVENVPHFRPGWTPGLPNPSNRALF